jgi:ATP-binding cassette, subfamily B, bacterial
MALVVSPRLAPARQADLIVAMDGSRVVAAGTHQELTRAGGPYLEMFSRQAESYVD